MFPSISKLQKIISDDNINLAGSHKITSGLITNLVTILTVEINDGVITWSDTNNIVTNVKKS